MKIIKEIVVLLIFITSCQKKSTTITLLHINDTHAKHLPILTKDKISGQISTNGGAAQLASLIKDLKIKNKNTIAVHAGDSVTGSIYSLMYKGIDSSEIMNKSGFDLAILGNHEFDFGLENTYKILKIRNFPTIGINIYEKDTGILLLPPTFSTNLGGISIGFVGLLTSDEVYFGKNKKGEHIVTDAIESLRNFLKTDHSIQTNDLLILLSHVGIELDKKIATEFPNIFDIIIGGHSHTFLPQPVKINKTLIVQLHNNIKELGKLELNIKNADHKIKNFKYTAIPIKNMLMDPEITSYLDEISIPINEKFGETLGFISERLDDENIREKSIPLGNFICDIIFDHYKDENIDFFFINAGSIRSSLEAGKITLGNIYEIHPFGNKIISLEIQGSTLKKIFESAVQKNHGEGGFFQLSRGVFIEVAKNKTIENIRINNIPIDNNKFYKIMTSDWIFNGGDSYSTFKIESKNQKLKALNMRDFIIKKIIELKYIDTSKIDKTPRWVFK